MAAKINCQNLDELRKSARKSNLSGKEIETPPFIVLAINRYIRDLKHNKQIGGAARAGGGNQPIDVIQLTLGDAHNKLKVLLGYRLLSMVQTCKVRAGDSVTITKCSLYYDETDLSTEGVLTVEQLSVVEQEQDLPDVTGLSWCDGGDGTDGSDVPLTSSRGYFVSVWSTWQMSGDIWKTQVPDSTTLGDTTPQDIYCIKDLARNQGTARRSNRALLVRVSQKNRIHHYVKPFKDDKWPFQAKVWIEDQSGVCAMVLWNSMCPSWYYRLKEGVVLLLRNYTVKKAFRVGSEEDDAPVRGRVYDMDVNVNSHNPPAEIIVIDPAEVPQELELPPLQYNLVTRRAAGFLPQNGICDIVGVVTYVGRCEREPARDKFLQNGEDTGAFWVQQWVHVHDGTSPRPFCLQLYTVSMSMPEPDIRPGSLLLCSNMRVIQHRDQLRSSRQRQNMFASTTKGTMVQVLDDDQCADLADSEEVVAAVRRWSRTRDCEALVQDAVVGGYHPGPPLPVGQTQLINWGQNQQMLCSSQWQSVLTNFSYRERRGLVAQATMVHVAYHSASSSRHYSQPDRASSSRQPDRRPSRHRLSEDRTEGRAPVEVLLEPDAFGGDVPCVGAGALIDDGALPVGYHSDQWSRVQLTLPRTRITEGTDDESQDAADVELIPTSYFTITWASINNHVNLRTTFLCPRNIPHGTTFTELLSGSLANQNLLDRQSSRVPICPGDEKINSVTDTVQQCSEMIFLLVLDCTQADSEQLEIILNRAVPLKRSV